MNMYALMATAIGTDAAAALSRRLAAWHDAMVAHERRLRARAVDACDDDCPHAEAAELWAEAVATFGARADELAFLRAQVADDGPRGPCGGWDSVQMRDTIEE